MLFAAIGVPHCPLCNEPVTAWSARQMLERLFLLPEGTQVEVRAPVFPVYGEDYEFLVEHIRSNGYRYARVDGQPVDLGGGVDLDDGDDHQIEAVVDTFIV